MSAQAKLAAALKKKADDDDVPPPPLAPIAPEADRDTLKLRKSNLLGTFTWEVTAERLALNNKHEFTALMATVQKMFGNVLANPTEPKYRKIKQANPNFQAKVYSCKGAPELFSMAGFKEIVEDGVAFLVLPEAADLALLQKALDLLVEQDKERNDSEEKKRKLEAEKASKAREERARKAREEANPAAYDAAVSSVAHGSAMVDEDEAMVDAITEWMEAHPDVEAGRGLDAFDIERQVPGPGGSVVASVVASAGTKYYDFVAYMKRSEAGAWSVQKMQEGK